MEKHNKDLEKIIVERDSLQKNFDIDGCQLLEV
jgi:hypothetical protein